MEQIDKAKLLKWINGRLSDGNLPPPSGIFHAYTDLKRHIKNGVFDPDPAPVPTLQKGDKDTGVKE